MCFSVTLCPVPPKEIVNGYLHGDVYVSGSLISYRCKPGFTFRDPNDHYNIITSVSVRCGVDGIWNKNIEDLHCASTCLVPVQLYQLLINFTELFCGDPHTPPNSSVSFTSDEYNANATVTCVAGHVFDQNRRPHWFRETIRCSENQEWTPAPKQLTCSRTIFCLVGAASDLFIMRCFLQLLVVKFPGLSMMQVSSLGHRYCMKQLTMFAIKVINSV